jgi:hypothetical protein
LGASSTSGCEDRTVAEGAVVSLRTANLSSFAKKGASDRLRERHKE